MQSYRFGSIAEYRALLSLYGITVEEVNGERNGKAYNGLVYSPITRNNEKICTPIKSSRIGRSVGYAALVKKTEKTKKYAKENPVYDRTKRIVAKAMEGY